MMKMVLGPTKRRRKRAARSVFWKICWRSASGLLRVGDLHGDGYDVVWGIVPYYFECIMLHGLQRVWIDDVDNPSQSCIADVELSGYPPQETHYQFIGEYLVVMTGKNT
ncbi:MAG: hypothetical protein Q4P66_07870 [Actinomycetaceae bacterium]|nr:hypothetical protein [Actinomycetaceae bacterium]